MDVLGYATPQTPRARRRLGPIWTALAIWLGVLLFVLRDFFGPIPGGSRDHDNPIGIAACIGFVVWCAIAVSTRIKEEDHVTQPRIVTSRVAIIITSCAFAYQFGWARRTQFDDARLLIWAIALVACSMIFLSTRQPTMPMPVPVAPPKPPDHGAARHRLVRATIERPDMASALIVLLLAIVFFGIPPLVYAARIRTWHEFAQTHQFPPNSLQYSLNPADRTQFPSGHNWVDPYAEQMPIVGSFTPMVDCIFLHELRHASGQRSVVYAVGSGSLLDISFIHIRGFSTTTIHSQRLPLESSIPGGLANIRLFSGKIDPDNPSRFLIPVQNASVSGHLVVTWQRKLPSMPGDQILMEVNVASISFEPDMDNTTSRSAAK